jgi:hypothetical protein
MQEHSEPSRPAQHIYIPALDVDVPDSLKKLPIARLHAPKRSCGIAQRIGHTSDRDDAQPIYRLKIKEKTARWQSITLPGFFLLQNNRFVKWEPSVSETPSVKSTHLQEI